MSPKQDETSEPRASISCGQNSRSLFIQRHGYYEDNENLLESRSQKLDYQK
ncbi:hypothetical protein Hanom_Chr09g00844361 [Helianthus anomalus]